MIEARDKFDDWLDTALAEYSKVEPPVGWQSRVIASMHVSRRRSIWMWSAAIATAAMLVIAFVAAFQRSLPKEPPIIGAQIAVPAIERVELQAGSSSPSVLRRPRLQSREVSVRGVPIVAAPITPQEEAVLRLVRNSRARQLAGLVVQPRDLSKETDLLQFKEMEIPVLGREEEK